VRSFTLGRGSTPVRSHQCAFRHWWTPERDAKLLYVMQVHDDLVKAARVLGVPPGNGGWLINRLKDYRQGRAGLTDEQAKQVETLLNDLLSRKATSMTD
jgi:hypothetical protein